MSPKLRQLAMAFARHPLLWGVLASVLFYVGLEAEVINDPMIVRYFTGHWTAYACTTMFLVGAAAVVNKVMDLLGDYKALNATLFEGLPASDMPIADRTLLLQKLDAQPTRLQRSYLIVRLRAALDYLGRKGSTEELEDELRSLAEADADRKQASYGMVRIMLWSMPFVGSLGTVVGIANAVASLGPDVVNSVSAVTPGLKLALETTALSLLLSVMLMLVMFIADHIESRLLAAVDARANRELVGRFRGQVTAQSGPLGAAPGMSDAVVEAMEKMAQRQAEMWQANLEAVTKHWDEQTELLKKQIETTGAGSGGGRGGAGGGGGGVSLEASQLQEVLLQSASMASMHHAEMIGQNEIILQLAEVCRQDSRNWPVRKAIRRRHNPGAAMPAADTDTDTDWLQRG